MKWSISTDQNWTSQKICSCRRKPMKRILNLLWGMLFILLTCDGVWAQAVSSAQMNGTVRDQTGAVIPGAEIKATQTATGAARTAVTEENGTYVMTNLPIGPYMLEVSLPGF